MGKYPKLRRGFLFYILVTLLASCVNLHKNNDRKNMFEQHLKIWENFRLEGIVEINYNQFQIRQNIVIVQSKNNFVLNIFKSGIFGLSGKNFLKIQIDDKEVKISGLVKKEFGEINFLDEIPNFIEMLSKNQNKIITNHKIEINHITYFFDKTMKLSYLKNGETEVRINYKSNQPNKIEVLNKNKIIATVYVDNFDD